MKKEKTTLIAPVQPASVVAWRDVGNTKYNPSEEYEELHWLGGMSEASAKSGGLPMGEGYFIHERHVVISEMDDENFDISAFCLAHCHCTPDAKYMSDSTTDLAIYSSWDDAAVAAGVHAWKRGLFLPASAQYANDKKAPYKTNTPGIVGLDKDETRYYFGDMGKSGRPKGLGFFATRRRMDGVKGENCWGLAVGYGQQHTHHFVVNHNQEDMFDYAMAGLVRRMLAESRKGAK